ncbi:hypothetical protein DSM106972_047810 [Dulcicalothrix desertica PCC 7102]|uniref:CRISPR-associated protein n=1 Tax=Dulcicalothrix desertica PCC 7102 TaxID=232991 RepID=A0A3S1CL98_9CYAN|nr:type III-B CRISPR module-associated Cmr3 family protein [Dulcicalothrix desertica]RUT03867.1 hypothetical protein DSM106972_047810 [Dulcicalothrix desertica PCC 7102]TWH43722.1 CRISPR-associated protein Cmr3 [Dulcicalothrix desertica PCC 7102]
MTSIKRYTRKNINPVQFKYLVVIKPLGMMYGSSGAFLSPENLVGRSGSKFPPDAVTLSGLLINAYTQHINEDKNLTETQKREIIQKFKDELYTAGPFWAEAKREQEFYVPIPWHRVMGEDETNEWRLDVNKNWEFKKKIEPKLEPDYSWQRITFWTRTSANIKKSRACGKPPWKYIPILHPHMEDERRNTLQNNGLFLENAVQMPPNIHLVYLSTQELPPQLKGWHRFGGENHIVELETLEITREEVLDLLNKPIQKYCALITPGIWGSTRLSYRYPQHKDFPKPINILTDKPIPCRSSLAGRLGRGRYAVPPGTVYVFDKPLGKPWCEWDEEWFPSEGYPMKQVGCGLCLPIEIEDLSLQSGVA